MRTKHYCDSDYNADNSLDSLLESVQDVLEKMQRKKLLNRILNSNSHSERLRDIKERVGRMEMDLLVSVLNSPL